MSDRKLNAFDLVAAQPWAIEPATLEVIAQIARRENETPEAVAAKLGRPLQNTRTVSVRDGVAIVPVSGPIFRYANLFTDISGATSLDVLARDFTAAVNDPAIKAIVLELDSPGGQASGIAEFAQMVRSASKPVTAYVDGMAASAAYWIAAAADQIVISKTGMVGSIGAVVALDTRPQVGVMEIVSSQSPKKRVDATTDEGRAQIQARIDELAQVFIDDVATYRGVTTEKVLADFGQGDVRMGESAVKLGMADRVATLEEVIAGLASNNTGGHMTATTKGQPAAEQQPVIDRAYLEAHHADIVAAFRAEGAATARAEGASAERERIQSVMAQSLAGHESLIQSLAFDGKTTGPEAAVAVLGAEKTARGNVLTTLKAESIQPLAQPAEPDAIALQNLPLEERCKAQWDADAKLRGEFANNYTAFLAYERASADGKVKVLKSAK